MNTPLTRTEVQDTIRALVDAQAQLTLAKERYDRLFFTLMDATQHYPKEGTR